MRHLVLLLTMSVAVAVIITSLLSPAAAMAVPFTGTFVIAEPGGVALFGSGLVAFGGLIALRRWRLTRTSGRRAARTRSRIHRSRWRIRWPAGQSHGWFSSAQRH